MHKIWDVFLYLTFTYNKDICTPGNCPFVMRSTDRFPYKEGLEISFMIGLIIICTYMHVSSYNTWVERSLCPTYQDSCFMVNGACKPLVCVCILHSNIPTPHPYGQEDNTTY